MASAQAILGRIKSVKNIGQVTRAMEAVSASRMRKAQERTLASREYANKAREVLSFLASQPGASGSHPLLQDRDEIKKVLLILITSNRGLAGALISNTLRVAMRFIAQNSDKQMEVATVGKKARDFMVRYGPRLAASFENPADKTTSGDARAISQVAQDGFLSGEYDAVYVVYAEFLGMMAQTPKVLQLLPMQAETEAPGASSGPSQEYTIEPNAETVLAELLPSLVDMQIYQALLESLSSEHSARMVAMKAATDNAKQLAEDYRLTYNKARQASITNEILDIVGGAEALAQSGK